MAIYEHIWSRNNCEILTKEKERLEKMTKPSQRSEEVEKHKDDGDTTR